MVTIVNSLPKLPNKKRVCAYARVSLEKETMLHSLAHQVAYYRGYIESNPTWEFAGIYADEGITGTKESRPDFQRMMRDARHHKFDLILVKSISRFARNSVTLLKYTRELALLGIDVYFEEEELAAFVKSFNEMPKPELINDLKLVIDNIDIEGQRAKRQQLMVKIETLHKYADEVVAKLKSPKENPIAVKEEYDAIEIEDNDLKVKLKKANGEIARMESLICRLNTFIKAMENSEDLITDFNPKYWVTMLERADVGEDFIKFTYYSGYTNIIKI